MHSDTLNGLEEARRLDSAGRREEAVGAFGRFLEAHPDSVPGWVDFAGLLMVLGRLTEARVACDKALALQPQNYGALVHSAAIHMHACQFASSERQFREAMAIQPERLSGRLMFADCMAQKGDLFAARELLDGILKQQPGHPHALDRLNTLLVRQGDWTALRRDMERQVAPYAGAEADYVASHVDLMFGDMPKGWQRFESRLLIPGRPSEQRTMHQPRWTGEPFPNQTLLLTWEQGFGDTLMFLRYAALAKARGGRVLVEVQPPLVDLAGTCPGIDEVVAAGADLPPFDFHASLLSLPAILGTTLDTIPCTIPYLDLPVDIPAHQEIAQLLSASPNQTRIGICWAGSRAHPKDAKRSMPSSALKPLGELPGIAWHSFQFEATELPPLPGIVPFGPLLKGFPNTAYALSGMDLVITVDTVLAHLAGALGIPTFLLLTFIPDWRWMLGRDDTPWYPSMRLYRQATPGDWSSVVRQVAEDLSATG